MASREEIAAGWRITQKRMAMEEKVDVICQTLGVSRKKALEMVAPHVMNALLRGGKTPAQIAKARGLRGGEMASFTERVRGMDKRSRPELPAKNLETAWTRMGRRARRLAK